MQQVFWQSWRTDQFFWRSADPSGPAMQLDGAFRRFAHAVNATPGNAGYELAVLRNHADCTTTKDHCFYWTLGRGPGSTNPMILGWERTSFSTANAYASSSGNLTCRASFQSYYNADPALNQGYGKFSASLFHYAWINVLAPPAGTYAQPVVLVIFQDTTPGEEVFGFSIKQQSHTANPAYDTTFLIHRTASGLWGSFSYQPAAHGVYMNDAYLFYGHTLLTPNNVLYQTDLIGRSSFVYDTQVSEDQFPRQQQLLNRVVVPPGTNDVKGIFAKPLFAGSSSYRADTIKTYRPQVLPKALYLGNAIPSPAVEALPKTALERSFGRAQATGGCFYQLGCKGAPTTDKERNGVLDLWLRVDGGHQVDQPAPWQPIEALDLWRDLGDHAFITQPPVEDQVVLAPIHTNLEGEVPIGNVWGVASHPVIGKTRYAGWLSGNASGESDPSGDGGSGGSGGTGGSRGGSGSGSGNRPAAGLLWPRQT